MMSNDTYERIDEKRDRYPRRGSPVYEPRERSASPDGNRRRRRERRRSRSPGARNSRRRNDHRGHSRHSNYRRKQHESAKMSQVEDPFAALRRTNPVAADPAVLAKQIVEQQMKARELVLQQQVISAIKAAKKTQRELYIGNIVPGSVTESMVRELFRTTLIAAFPDKCQDGAIDPVTRVALVEGQKYCFVEVLDAEMATACIELSGKIQLAGTPLTVGRPASYRDPEQAHKAAHSAASALAKFQAESEAKELESQETTIADLEARPSPFICIEGVISKDDVQVEEGKDTDGIIRDVVEDVQTELERHGTVYRVNINTDASSDFFCKALVHFSNAADADKAREAIDGRLFDGRTLKATRILAKDYFIAAGL
jgi:hypothetical protein